MTHPVSAGVTAWATVRATFVVVAAASRSWSATIAIRYACRVGTSICERRWRTQRRAIATEAVGANAIRISTTLDTRRETTIVARSPKRAAARAASRSDAAVRTRSEEHTSELQSQSNLVCRLLLEKKNKRIAIHQISAPTGSPTSTANAKPH